jgi:hypothetical protein
MKLSKTQTHSLAKKIFNEINEAIKLKKEAFIESKEFKIKLSKEMDKYKPAIKLVESGLLESFRIPDYYYTIRSLEDIEKGCELILINSLDLQTVYYGEIENEIVLATIDCPDLETIVSSIKSKYEL